MGGEGEPDVVATALLGDRAYTVVAECKTVATADDQVRNPAAQEAGRLRDLVAGDYAVLLGGDFPRAAEIDGELQTHRVARWTCDDLAAASGPLGDAGATTRCRRPKNCAKNERDVS